MEKAIKKIYLTNVNGMVILDKKVLNKDLYWNYPFIIVSAKKGDHHTFINLKGYAKEKNKWNTSTFSTGGLDKNNTVFIYSDRDVYRPGSTIFLSAIFRNEINEAIDDGFIPIKLIVKNSKGQIVHETVNQTGLNGFYSFHIPTDLNALTGTKPY